jgi:hypothetical protein
VKQIAVVCRVGAVGGALASGAVTFGLLGLFWKKVNWPRLAHKIHARKATPFPKSHRCRHKNHFVVNKM